MSTQPAADIESVEDLASFRRRARAWIRANLTPVADVRVAAASARPDEEELASVAYDRGLQRLLFDAGFAGLCFPREYGGQGLTPGHHRAFNEELAGYEYPAKLAVPTFSPCAAVLLEFGTEEQKREHLPAILRGDAIWSQLLSEPSGGSDVAGALTTAVRDGDEWVLNGSKIWTSKAWWADWALCLARTSWDVPKHQGLTVFIVSLRQPGIDVRRIEMLNGSRSFCQEFLTDVRVPDTARVGATHEGWRVGRRWMSFERLAHNSPYVTVPVGASRGSLSTVSPVTVAREAGRADDPTAQVLIGESKMLEIVARELQRRVAEGFVARTLSEHMSSVTRLFTGMANVRRATINYELAGDSGAIWDGDDGSACADIGLAYLMRQAACIGGGTTEIARNVISERVLGMPRERAGDRDVPFRDVPRGGR